MQFSLPYFLPTWYLKYARTDRDFFTGKIMKRKEGI
jgi:hypothetical protein